MCGGCPTPVCTLLPFTGHRFQALCLSLVSLKTTIPSAAFIPILQSQRTREAKPFPLLGGGWLVGAHPELISLPRHKV